MVKDWTGAQKDAIYARDKSIAVSAAAGSGKTAVLTRRIIERVCDEKNPIDISRVLVVTFMREAAAELVNRISKALSEQLALNPSNKHIASQLLFVSSAKISTIHSFCLDVIRGNFETLGLPSDFHAADSIELDTIMLNTAQTLIDELYEENVPGCPVKNFTYLADTLGSVKDEAVLKENIVDIYKKLATKAEFLDSLDICAGIYRDCADKDMLLTPWGPWLRTSYADSLIKRKKSLLAFIDEIKDVPESEKVTYALEKDCVFIESLVRLCEKEVSAADIQETINKHEHEKAKPKILDEDRQNRYKSVRETGYKGALKKILSQVSMPADDVRACCMEMVDILTDLSAVMREYDRRLTIEKNKRHIISFADMEQKSLALLWDKQNNCPTALAREIADTFDEIYVDEYQDTNEVQDKIFEMISRDNNRFCVGDVKQSIYAFRGAEPSLFTNMLNKRNKYSKESDEKAVKIFLSKNFRSSDEILGFTNDIFTRIMNVCGDIKYGDDEKLVPGLNLSCGKVTVAVGNKANEEDEDSSQEAEYVASEIEKLLTCGKKADGSRILPSDIVILLRYGKHAPMYAAALEKHGIPNSNTADNELFGTAEVLLIMSLLNAIDNPARDVYVAAALKSPIYGVTLDELIYIRKYKSDGTLYDALCSFTADKGFKKGERFISDIKKYRRMANGMPCDKLIWRIYLDTSVMSIVSKSNGDSLYSAEQAKSNLIQLYNFARQCEKGTYRGLYHFISLVNEILQGNVKTDLSQFGEPGNVVKMLTVHKSKGLEYPVVFLCSCGGGFNKEDKSGNYIFSPWGLVPRLINKKEKTHILAAADKAFDHNTVTEEMRMLYVALTRAREKLYVVGSVKLKDEETVYEHMAHLNADDYGSVVNAKSFLELIGQSAVTSEYCEFTEISSAPTSQPVTQSAQTASKSADDVTYAVKRLVDERLSFKYKYDGLNRVPSKLSVSHLYPDVLDEADIPSEIDCDTEIESYIPAFLRSESIGFSAAERGTAMHTFMQFFDFDRVERDGAEAEVEYLLSHGFLYPDDREKLNISKLKKFFSSGLCAEMRSAKEIWREKRFVSVFPADRFTLDAELKEKLKDENMLVQGVIDCAYRDTDGKIVLVDYKTDSFRHDTPRDEIIKVLTERHSRQLEYYKFACEKLFGPVSRIYIYSFALDDAIELKIGG